MVDTKNASVSRDPEVVSGELVFTGTRVPAKSLIDYLTRRSPANKPKPTWT